MKLQFDPEATSWHFIHDILGQARKVDMEQLTAKHVVEAQMSIQFPDLSLPLPSCSGDVDSDNSGDLLVGNTVFHITVAPSPALYDKCRRAVLRDYSVYLLVPHRLVTGSWQYLDSVAPGQITVQSIESFVSQNIDELTSFSKEKLISGFRRLLEVYNERVDSVETDKSMLIEIPRNLLD